MNASDYQQQAARTLIDGPDFTISDNDFMILWNAIGLAGEAGEVAESVKKGILHQHGLDTEKMKKELGDCLWYIAALCTKLDLDMGEVMAANIEKLKVRYPDGYKSGDSIARVDIEPPDWAKAQSHLEAAERAYSSIPTGKFVLVFVVKPARLGFEYGERTKELYDEIMEIAL